MHRSLDILSTLMETAGTVAFAISGVLAAREKALDIFGLLVIALVTAIGGGTLRDMLLGQTPVAWLTDQGSLIVIFLAVLIALVFRRHLHHFRKTLFGFDALGLGFFTIVGLEKGLNAGLGTGVSIVLGTITGCFGGVIRDLLLNRIPVLFQQEIYATACVAGGTLFVMILGHTDPQLAAWLSALSIAGIRMIAYRYNWRLPVWRNKTTSL